MESSWTVLTQKKRAHSQKLSNFQISRISGKISKISLITYLPCLCLNRREMGLSNKTTCHLQKTRAFSIDLVFKATKKTSLQTQILMNKIWLLWSTSIHAASLNELQLLQSFSTQITNSWWKKHTTLCPMRKWRLTKRKKKVSRRTRLFHTIEIRKNLARQTSITRNLIFSIKGHASASWQNFTSFYSSHTRNSGLIKRKGVQWIT